MSGLKRKKDKIPISDNRKTLNQLHKEKMKYFYNLQSIVLPEKITKLSIYLEELKNCDPHFNKNYDNIRQLRGLKQRIKSLSQEIHDIRELKEENKYILNTHQILSQYYGINHGINIDTVKSSSNQPSNQIPDTDDHSYNNNTIPTNSILNYFFNPGANNNNNSRVLVKKPVKRSYKSSEVMTPEGYELYDECASGDIDLEQLYQTYENENDVLNNPENNKPDDDELDSKLYGYDELNGEIDSEIDVEIDSNIYTRSKHRPNVNISISRAKGYIVSAGDNHQIVLHNQKTKLLDKYLKLTDKHYTSAISELDKHWYKCDECNGTQLIKDTCSIICDDCGRVVEKYFDDDYRPSYKELQERTFETKFPYKRENHFSEWVNQFQAKESTNIPEEVYNDLKREIKKYRLKPGEITEVRLRQFLKKSGKNKYYEHIPFILNSLTGKPAPVLSKEIEKQFRIMFDEIQDPFQRHCPKNRKNFLSYSYALHKFCELLELDHLLCRFPYLKDRDKLYIQDTIWKNICKDLRWQFIPSL